MLFHLALAVSPFCASIFCIVSHTHIRTHAHTLTHTHTHTHTHTDHHQITGQKRALCSVVSLFFLHFSSSLTSHFPTSQNTISSKQTHPPTHTHTYIQSNSSRIKPEKVQCARYCTSNRQHCTSSVWLWQEHLR